MSAYRANQNILHVSDHLLLYGICTLKTKLEVRATGGVESDYLSKDDSVRPENG